MRNVVLGILIALGAHAALAFALLAYFRFGPRSEAPAMLDLSSVELSLSEEDGESAAVAPAVPSQAPLPQPLPPEEVEPPPEPARSVRSQPPDPAVGNIVEPDDAPPVLETPQPRSRETGEAAARQAQVDAPARPERTIRPDYPARARRRGEQGEVALEIDVSAEGTVTGARVAGSCGFPELDAAAVRAVRAARFVPGRSGDRPAASTVYLKIAFRLK